MKKKGFTLIEMLAVLVILAVIALIIMPIVTNVIKSAKKAAFKESVNNIIEATDNYVGEHVLANHEDLTYPVILICDGTTCEDMNGTKLTFKGAVPKSGKVILDSASSIRADLVSNGEWCASGLKGQLEVYEDCTLLDHTNPEIDESKLNDIVISTTTNTLTLSLPEGIMFDLETGIVGYNVELYLNDTKVDSKAYNDPHIIFSNLKNGTEYKVVITATNGNGGKTSIDKYGTTLDIIKPTITYTNDPTTAVGGYFKSQTLNVSYTVGNIVSPSYYIRSGRDASTNIDVIASCGTGDEPSSCTSMTSTSIQANTWYQVSGNINVIYNVNANEESYLTALIYDGTNYDGADSKTIARIEANGLTAPVITGGSNDYTNTNRTISVSEAGAATTGVAKYQYYISTSSTSQTGGSWADVSGTSQAISTEGEHYVFFRTVSNLGNTSDASNAQTVKVDTQAPGGASSTIRQTNSSGTAISNANTWRIYTVWWGSFTATDNGTSGINRYEYSTNCTGTVSGTLNNSTGYTYGNGINYTFCIRAVDNAGNPGAWSGAYYFKVDTDKPTISSVSVSGKVGTINKADTGGSGLASYCVRTSNSSSGCSWTANTGSSVAWTSSSAGTYYAFVKDVAGNISDGKAFTIPTTAFCTLTSNSSKWEYNYTGGVQSFTVPANCTGTYKLEVWGAQGGGAGSADTSDARKVGGKGGYSYGNATLTAGSTIYIVVGGQGSYGTQSNANGGLNGGYNGGGKGGGQTPAGSYKGGGSGGGATHIGKQNATLANTSSSNVYIVAGGGGGGYYHEWDSHDLGGTDGGAGNSGSGGASYGQGGNGGGGIQAAGGGGGWSGGVASSGQFSTAAGGTGYTGGVTGGGMQAGQRAGNGFARITFVSLN